MRFVSKQLRVDEPAVEADDDDDISEPDEDTLAGQLAAMKGEKVKRKGSDGEDGSSSEEDSDDDSSSDEDGPKGKNDDDSSDSDSD